MTYRARPADGVAWVTGASAGIGRAVALELARRGFTVIASARRQEALHALTAEAQGISGSIEPAPCDVTDREAVSAVVKRIEEKRPIALALLNAGGASRDARADFGGPGFQATFALNVQGVANCINPVFNAMRERRRGQIAVVGSLSSYGGMPNAYAYAPSKAAVASLTVGLKFLADPVGVTVQLINPGFVRTPLTAGNKYPMPFLMEPDIAARRIVDGLERHSFEIRFPLRLAFIFRALNLLPYRAYFWVFQAFKVR
jgi:short-subunit dehydrogenase